MADTKLTDLGAIASIATGDLVYVVDDPGGTPASTKATVDQLKTFMSNSPTLVTPNLGTPSAGTLTSCTGLPISTGVSGLGTGVATFLATPSSANLASAVTDETGTGALVFASGPTLVTPVAVSGDATGGAEVRLYEDTDNGTNYMALKANANIASNFTLTFPADDGTSGQYLKTDGSGVLSWDTPSGGGTPGGSDTQVQFNDGGSFGGDSGFTYNKTTDTLTLAGNIKTTGGGSGAKISIETSGQPTVGFGRNGAIGGLDLFGDNLSTPTMNISQLFASVASTFSIQWSGSSIGQPADTILHRVAVGILGVRGSSTSTGGALSFVEQTAPSAPAANGVYIYAQDNGAGKTQLMALFASGSAQQIAIEP